MTLLEIIRPSDLSDPSFRYFAVRRVDNIIAFLGAATPEVDKRFTYWSKNMGLKIDGLSEVSTRGIIVDVEYAPYGWPSLNCTQHLSQSEREMWEKRLWAVALELIRLAFPNKLEALRRKFTKQKAPAMADLFRRALAMTGAPAPAGASAASAQKSTKKKPEPKAPDAPRVLIVGTMSSGKSTLLNALLGRKAASAANAACTRKCDEYEGVLLTEPDKKLKLIDTPGVNNAYDDRHRSSTLKALGQGGYQAVLCVVNSQYLGTDEQEEFLDAVHRLASTPVIYALNMLDDHNPDNEAIKESIEALRRSLSDGGPPADAPIAPISAKYALLRRLRWAGSLQEADRIWLEQNEPRLSHSYYDLPRYIGRFSEDRSGVSTLEQILITTICRN